jgi:KaiC/GvpD/RAD55 family RecA-like ATPase
MQVDFIRTYVEGFDKELGGGIPKGHIVLIAGAPGTMKSSLSFSIMYNNMKKRGSKALYITIEESKESLVTGMERLGMGDFNEKSLAIVDIGKLRLEYRVVEETRNWLKILMEHLQTKVASEGYEFVVLDSLTALSSIMEFENPRQELYHFFGFLKGLKVTTLLLTEVIREDDMYGTYHEAYLADGLIYLKYHDVGETESQLRMKCAKMRYTKHNHGFMALLFKEGTGFMVTPVISE